MSWPESEALTDLTTTSYDELPTACDRPYHRPPHADPFSSSKGCTMAGTTIAATTIARQETQRLVDIMTETVIVGYDKK